MKRHILARINKKKLQKADVDSEEYRKVSKWVNIKWRIIHICEELIPARNWTRNFLHPKAVRLYLVHWAKENGLFLDCDSIESGAQDSLPNKQFFWRPATQKGTDHAGHILPLSKAKQHFLRGVVLSQPLTSCLQFAAFSLISMKRLQQAPLNTNLPPPAAQQRSMSFITCR